MTINHFTKISVALATALIGAAGSFFVVRSQVSDLRSDVTEIRKDTSKMKEDVAYIKGRLELQSKVSSAGDTPETH